ncbi:hypothetical protein WAE58_04375 [Pedobacter panaciterrae]|uniref:Membrane protein DUF2207 n=1 Tax=Pedobacter panaciterrae TaxID=363849 RepID=A0ABU8NHJ2_9SPHI
MISLDVLVGLFNSNYEISNTQEDFEIFEQKCVLKSTVIPTEQSLQDYISLIPDGDSLAIYVTFEGAEAITFIKETDFYDFKSAMELGLNAMEENSSISLKINITKSVFNNRLTLYSLSDFETYLNGFATRDLLEFFSEKIKIYGNIVFQAAGISAESWSASLGFVNSSWTGDSMFVMKEQDRNARLKSIQSSTHAVVLSDMSIIPEDFHFFPVLGTTLKAIFDKLSLVMIIMATFDLTNLKGNTLTYRLNGYKGIDGNADISTLAVDECIGEYSDIYSWINQSGNLNDKLGLARNIISLHLNPSNDLLFTGSMYSSVLSAYKVYEKQNIKQYIEIRNKLSDQLIDYNRRANSIVEGFASTFQKSALSVLTLFASIIAIKVLSNSSPAVNFVAYSVGFSMVVLLISLVHMFISRSETFEQRRRYSQSYLNFKERYTDLLNHEDIQRILNHDVEFNADIIFINRKIRNYTILWSVVLILITAFIFGYLINEKYDEINLVMASYPNV